MGVHIRRWGNSAAVRLPAHALAAAGIGIDDRVVVREEGGRIVIERAEPEKITLKWLMEGFTPDTVSGETDWGPPVGKEIW